jgi:4-amino-4-deoxy-L-arabinose transferase-like glycosyltransferase
VESTSDARRIVAFSAVIFALAILTRFYALGSFPYFPTVRPWNGAFVSQSSLQGLYSDEYNYLQSALGITSTPPHLSLYQPPLALLFLDASVKSLGLNTFAVRMPFAMFSSLTAVFVYLISTRLSKSNRLGFASSIFYIAMVPALIYGRMAFLENVSAFFFVGAFYFLLRYKDEQRPGARNRWLIVAGLLAGLSSLAKVTGLVSVLFILLVLYRERSLRRSIRPLLPMIVLVVLFPLSALFALGVNPLKLASFFPREYGLFLVGSEVGAWRFFLFETLPSGFTAMWGGSGGFPIPEFWYITLYITLAALAIKEYPRYSDLVLALSVFAAFEIAIVHLGSYHLIYMQPLLAVSFGPGVRRLLLAPTQVSLGLFSFLYVPLVISLGVNVVTGTGAGNPFINSPYLFLWKLLLVLVPLFALFLSTRDTQDHRLRKTGNLVLIVAFLVLLLVGSYLSPDLYAQYFYQSSYVH